MPAPAPKPTETIIVKEPAEKNTTIKLDKTSVEVKTKKTNVTINP